MRYKQMLKLNQNSFKIYPYSKITFAIKNHMLKPRHDFDIPFVLNNKNSPR